MANVLTRRFLIRNTFKFKRIIETTKHSNCASIFFINCNATDSSLFHNNHFSHGSTRLVGTSQIQFYTSGQCKNEKKPSLFQRFKQMYKDYWYVLVPVHLVTSAAWFGGFYYLAKSGVDVPALLQSLGISEKIVNPLRDSSMGYLALAYALYKVATPARYTVTLAGTTVSINYLKKWGYIKPVPSKARLKEIYHERKDNILETMRETKEGLKDKKEHIIEDLDKTIKQFKELGDKAKSKEHVEKDKDKNKR